MTADSSRPLTERERRALDALAVGLADSDPSFVSVMRTGRERVTPADRASRGGRLLGLALVRAATLLGACVLAGAVSIGAVLLGPFAVLALGPLALVAVGCLAVRRSHQGRSSRGRGRS